MSPDQLAARGTNASPSRGLRLLGHSLNFGSGALVLWLAALVILFGTTTTFASQYSKTVGAGAAPIYSPSRTSVSDFSNVAGLGFLNFQFILISVGVGFPLLSVVSRRTSWAATYIALLLSALTLLWAQLLKGFWANARYTYDHPDAQGWGPIPLSWDSLLLAVYIAAAVHISHGAVAGRASLTQGVGLAFFAAFFATANQQIGEEIEIYDSGGCFYIHTFGAVFGLAASYFLYDQTASEKHSYTEARRKTPGLLSFMGLALVFAVLPVFNSGLAAYAVFTNLASASQTSLTLSTLQPLLRALAFRAYFNTLCSVSTSVASAFAISKALSPRGTSVNLAHLQIAAVAGGAAVASFAHALSSPWGALLTGAVTGAVAVWSIILAQPLLDKALVLDASAVFSTHALPGMIGAIGSAIAFNRVTTENGFDALQVSLILPYGRDALTQGGYQLAYWAITAAFAAISGAFTGLLLNLPIFEAQTANEGTLNDDRDTFEPILQQ